MTGVYDSFQNVADRLLTKYNDENPFEVLRKAGEMFGGEFLPVADITLTAIGVIVPNNRGKINNTVIEIGDLTITITRDYVPKMGDLFLIDGGKFSVVDYEIIKPSGTVICYRVLARK